MAMASYSKSCWKLTKHKHFWIYTEILFLQTYFLYLKAVWVQSAAPEEIACGYFTTHEFMTLLLAEECDCTALDNAGIRKKKIKLLSNATKWIIIFKTPSPPLFFPLCLFIWCLCKDLSLWIVFYTSKTNFQITMAPKQHKGFDK